jgi:hypothetical protein
MHTPAVKAASSLSVAALPMMAASAVLRSVGLGPGPDLLLTYQRRPLTAGDVADHKAAVLHCMHQHTGREGSVLTVGRGFVPKAMYDIDQSSLNDSR